MFLFVNFVSRLRAERSRIHSSAFFQRSLRHAAYFRIV